MLDQIAQDFEVLAPEVRLTGGTMQAEPVQIEGEAFKPEQLVGRHCNLDGTGSSPRDFSQP
jgi:hypothetical protein